MSICREWTVVKERSPERQARPLECRSWGCDYCNGHRKAQLMALAASGTPNRFVTLTINPEVGDSPDHRLKLLSWAWRTIVKRLRRAHPDEPVEFLAIVESTKAGEPHLHILLRAPFIKQQWLSDAMRDLAGSPIVDIRRIRNQREVIRYVSKYVTKDPHHFGTGKRYWHSKNYEPPEQKPLPDPDLHFWNTYLLKQSISMLMLAWQAEGYRFHTGEGRYIHAYLAPDPPPWD